MATDEESAICQTGIRSSKRQKEQQEAKALQMEISVNGEVEKSDELESKNIPPIMETQESLVEFLQMYHSFPCLWKYSCKDYKNRFVKECAYSALVEKLRETDPRADKSTVMRKINALRTAFRREYKKVRRSTWGSKNGKYPRRKYKPSLWYYDLLRFVVEQQDGPPSPFNNNVTNQSMEQEDGKDCHTPEGLMEYLEDTPVQPSMVKVEVVSPTTSRAASPNFMNLEINAVYSERNTARDNFPAHTAESVPVRSRRIHEDIVPESTKRPNPFVEPSSRLPHLLAQNLDEFDRFGVYVASKLRKSVDKQSVIAEKVIAEVLMRANLGTLEETTLLVDTKPVSASNSFLSTGER